MYLQIGSKSDLVQKVQARLKKIGFDPGPADGVFGNKTQKAVIKFQKNKKLEADGIVGAFTLKALDIRGKLDIPEMERSRFRSLILKNPNYFGTFPGGKSKPVKKIKANTKHEEIKCAGFYPETDLLEAVIDVKLPYGYKGNLCSGGSFEYIRFFIDWNGDGDFSDPDEDVGIASVNVHDIPNDEGACLDETKPLSYTLTLKIDPEKNPCKIPKLVKMRAILSWENPPTAGDPDFPPVWGNVVEKWIQIKPREYYIKDIVDFVDLKELGIEQSALDLDIPILKAVEYKPSGLKEIYKGKNVPEHRFNFTALNQIAKKIKQTPSIINEYKLDPDFKKIEESVNEILTAKPNTSYEELGCVGLNYDQDQMTATLTVKRPYGYNGNLCSDGSNEYVAFWAFIYDEIEQMCLWRYLGTASVNVHDIKSIPAGGLQYAVNLSVDLSSLRDTCHNPRVLKVRAILSWNTKPDPGNPYQSVVWGNKVDALIQIKPGVPVKPGERKPFIWGVGKMAVESIAGNPYTVLASSLGDGYANGVSVGGGFIADESPFGGKIAISGKITNAPDNPAPGAMLRYKIQYKKLPGGTWKDIVDEFSILKRIDGVPSGFEDQVADSGGYFKYWEDDAISSTPPKVEIQDNMLAIWRTPSDSNGLYKIRVLLYEPGALPQPDVPANHVASEEVKVMIDNTRPKAEISLDVGACQKFKVGDTVTGKFTATDAHIWKYTLSVLPASAPNPPVISPVKQVYPLLAPPGVTDETFNLTTTEDTTPCGYVIYLRVYDRTIVNNYMQGNRRPADVGFCLLEEE